MTTRGRACRIMTGRPLAGGGDALLVDEAASPTDGRRFTRS